MNSPQDEDAHSAAGVPAPEPSAEAPPDPFPLAKWSPVDALRPVMIFVMAQMAISYAIIQWLGDDGIKQHPVACISLLSLAQALAVGMVALALARLKCRPVSSLGLDRFPRARQLWLYAVLFFETFFVVMLLAQFLMPVYRHLGIPVEEQTPVKVLKGVPAGPALAWLVVLFVALVPLLEEVLFRGFLFPGLANRMGTFSAAVVTSAVFAVLHWEPIAIPPLFVLSLVLCMFYAKSRSLWLAVAGHGVFNALTVAQVFLSR